MKRVWTLLAVISLLMLSVQPAWARTCMKLVREGRDLLAKANLAEDQSNKIKALLDDAQKLHEGGDHSDSAKKGNEALELLKKK